MTHSKHKRLSWVLRRIKHGVGLLRYLLVIGCALQQNRRLPCSERLHRQPAGLRRASIREIEITQTVFSPKRSPRCWGPFLLSRSAAYET